VGVAVREGTLLDLVWVKPSMRSKGIGSTLMETVEDQAALDGKELTLEVWTVNRRAVDFYERRGFSIDGTVKDPITGLEKLVMRKSALARAVPAGGAEGWVPTHPLARYHQDRTHRVTTVSPVPGLGLKRNPNSPGETGSSTRPAT
jgi:hypothetical protein